MTENELLSRHPWLPYAGVGAGWFELLDELCTQIEHRLAERGLTPPDYLLVRQIKEKFGELRFYFATSPPARIEDLLDLVDAASDRSLRTCQTCGCPGERRLLPRGWIITACPEHDEKASRSYDEVMAELEADQALSMRTVLLRMQSALNDVSKN